MNTPTIQAPETKADLSAASPYDLLGTHAMRYEIQDVERLRASLAAAQEAMPSIRRAFQSSDVAGFCESYDTAFLEVCRALAKADAVLAALRAQ
jgi:hypothetical protein